MERKREGSRRRERGWWMRERRKEGGSHKGMLVGIHMNMPVGTGSTRERRGERKRWREVG